MSYNDSIIVFPKISIFAEFWKQNGTSLTCSLMRRMRNEFCNSHQL